MCGTVCAVPGHYGGERMWRRQLRHHPAIANRNRFARHASGGHSDRWSQVATSLAYTNSTAYLPVKSGSRHVQALTVSNSTSVFDQTISITDSANETLLLTGPVAKMQSLLLTDGATNTTITTGDGKVRVVNASQTMGPADVYIVNSGTSLAGATPTSPSLAFNKTTDYELEIIGNYQVFMTQPGTTNVLLNTGPLALTQSQFQTVIAVDAPGGGFTFIALTDQ